MYNDDELIDAFVKTYRTFLNLLTIHIKYRQETMKTHAKSDDAIATTRRLQSEIDLLLAKLKAEGNSMPREEVSKLCDEATAKADEIDRILSEHCQPPSIDAQ